MALTAVALTATARDGSVLLEWVATDAGAVPDDRWEIHRDGSLYVTLLDVDAVEYVDLEVANATRYSYTVTGETEAVASSAAVAVPGPRAIGHIDYLAAAARYSTIAAMKTELNLAAADVSRDAQLLQALIAAEVAVDSHFGRSFPDPSGGEIEGIPEAVKQMSLQAAMAVVLDAGAPDGSSGSDDWLGALPVDKVEVIRRTIAASPLGRGLRAGFGVG